MREEPVAEGATILVIEDDADMAETMRIILESKRYRVISASSKNEGLDKARAERPDLILLDVMMPEGTEGFHFVWELRRDAEPEVRDIPIIVVSALHQTTDLRFYPEASDDTYAAGEYLPVQDFVDKPVEPADLLQRVERVLNAAAT
jgi:CheY-like chemotaxis protein